MMTQTHILVAAAGFTKPGQPWRNAAALLGGFIPDAALYGLFFWARFNGVSAAEIFGERYWSPSWQLAMSPGNSIPLWLAVLVGGYLASKREGNWKTAGIAFMAMAGAALAHCALDLPFHVNDGHSHFWPFTTWKFQSPVSYWDPRHYGAYVRPFEFALGLACLFIIFRRFKARWVRALCLLGMAISIAEPIAFYLMMRAGTN